MQDIDTNIRKLWAVRDMGVEIAVDDFGAGYSSLGCISRLPINTLKIDRAFIMNMTGKPDDLSIVSTIISPSLPSRRWRRRLRAAAGSPDAAHARPGQAEPPQRAVPHRPPRQPSGATHRGCATAV